MIEIIQDPNQINCEIFFKKYVLESKPCLIKNFVKPDDLCTKYYVENKDYIETQIGNTKAYYSKSQCLNEFFSGLGKYVEYEGGVRTWKHSAGNITPWHYDGNGINVTNVCYSGSKRFYFSPPGSLHTLPVSNISIGHEKWNNVYIDIFPGDMLFIPAYWFHKVVCLQDNTFTVNHNFYHKSNNKFSTNRDVYLYTLHNFLSTHMCANNKICKYSKKNIPSALVFGFYEFAPFYLLLLFITIGFYKIDRLWAINFLICLALICLVLSISPKLNQISSGISRIYSFYIFVYIFIAIGFIKLIK